MVVMLQLEKEINYCFVDYQSEYSLQCIGQLKQKREFELFNMKKW